MTDLDGAMEKYKDILFDVRDLNEAIALFATSILMLSGATRMIIASSLIDRITPRIPPAVVTLSPVLILASISCHCF